MSDDVKKFRSVFPHEPMPIESKGYVHIQGAFLPKIVAKAPAEYDRDEACDKPIASNINVSDVKDMILKSFQVTQAGENGLDCFSDYLPKDSVLHKLPIDCRNVISVTVLVDNIPVKMNKYKGEVNDENSTVGKDESTTISITKVRIEYSSPSIARRVVAFIRNNEISPAEIFHIRQNTTVSEEAYFSYAYSTKKIQATQVTQVPIPSSDVTWPRAGVPKFRRLLISDKNQNGVERIQMQRAKTRFVFMTNILEGGQQQGQDNSDPIIEPYMFQDALREAIRPFCMEGDNFDLSKDLAAEIFLPSKKQSSPFKYCHIGTRSPSQAQAIIRELQGKQITLKIKGGDSDKVLDMSTGNLFLDFVDITQRSAAKSNRIRQSGVRGGEEKSHVDIPGEPSKPECTSLTQSVIVPGLVCVNEFITEEEENVLVAVLIGPNAPWAPSQQNISKTGSVKRRVQHYGYVFDYETADVLRDRDSKEMDAECPPMPSLPSEYDGCSNETLESFANDSVRGGDGWNLLAAIVEKVRRYHFQWDMKDFQRDSFSSDVTNRKMNMDICVSDGAFFSSKDANHFEASIAGAPLHFPDINQLTVNEYKRGQGIGAHIDTKTAFDNGIISLSMGSDCVMEFRSREGTKKLVHLQPRSLLLMSGPARFTWSHQIVTRMTDCVDNVVIPRKTRVSMTLRTAITLVGDDGNIKPLQLVESSSFPPKWGNTNIPGDKCSDIATPETERSHVHAVYDAIATQWHHTRGKRGVLWPGATQFLKRLPMGSVVADVGCGDGKYFPAIWEAGSYVIGTDISEPLLQTSIGACSDFASKAGPESRLISSLRTGLNARPAVAVADCMHIPMRTSSCDAAICIAVMHHLSTTPRRLQCLRELSRIVKPGGRINVQAWALKQNQASKRKFAGTDVFVPFNAQPRYLTKVHNSVEENKQKSNERNTKCQGVAEMYSEAYDGAEYDEKKGLVVFQRYCHMYREGELEDLVAQITSLKVVESGFESGNYFVIMKVV